MKLFITKALGIFAIALLAGCAGTPVQIGQVTDASTIDRSKGEFMEASGTGFQLMLFIPLGTHGRQERAYQELLERAGKDRVLTDVSIAEWWYFGVIGTFYQSRIQATAYPKITLPAAPK